MKISIYNEYRTGNTIVRAERWGKRSQVVFKGTHHAAATLSNRLGGGYDEIYTKLTEKGYTDTWAQSNA